MSGLASITRDGYVASAFPGAPVQPRVPARRSQCCVDPLDQRSSLTRMDSPAGDEKRRAPAGWDTRLPFSFAYFLLGKQKK